MSILLVANIYETQGDSGGMVMAKANDRMYVEVRHSKHPVRGVTESLSPEQESAVWQVLELTIAHKVEGSSVER